MSPFQHKDPWRQPNENGTQVGGHGCEPGGTEKHEVRMREGGTTAPCTTDTTTDQREDGGCKTQSHGRLARRMRSPGRQ